MNSFIFYAEVHPTLWKGSENRKQNKMNSFIFYAEVHPTLCRDGDFAPCGVNFPDIHLHGDTLSEFLDV